MVGLGILRSALLTPPSLARSTIVVMLSLAAASILRWAFGSIAEPVPYVTYFPAIVMCTLLAGWRAGIACIAGSAAIVQVVFLGPKLRPTSDLKAAGMIALFVLSCLLLVGIAQTLRDTFKSLTEAKERANLLNRELLHRVRNTLAIVQSMAVQSYRADPENFVDVFRHRMAALTGALKVLSQDAGAECDLHAIIGAACQPFVSGENIRIAGATCMIPADSCVPLSLAIHELCTNAVKYGALSVPAGRVSIEPEASPDGKVILVWQEHAGPPVTPPRRSGLGSALLGHPDIGPANLQFIPSGLRCEMAIRVGE